MNYLPAQQRRQICRTQDRFSDMNKKGIKDLHAILEEFERERKSYLQRPTIWFWDDILKHVMLQMKMFIASSGLGVCEVNQYAQAELLPIVFATNRSIYSKYEYMSYMIFLKGST